MVAEALLKIIRFQSFLRFWKFFRLQGDRIVNVASTEPFGFNPS